jgi:hypothetical protein
LAKVVFASYADRPITAVSNTDVPEL